MERTITPRRRVLRVLACLGAAGLTSAGGGCVGQGFGAGSGQVSAGNLKDLPMKSLRAVDTGSVAIGRDGGGVYAVSLICTHQGCDMSYNGDVSYEGGINCGCHGASFDRSGGVLGGPAQGPLEHYRVTADASGALTIDLDTTVPSSTRLRV